MLFRPPQLDSLEVDVLNQIQRSRESLRHVTSGTPQGWFALLRRSTLARVVRATNSIEGLDVSVSDAIAAFENEDPLDADDANRTALYATFQAMNYVLRLSDDPHFTTYSVDLLRSLHFMMLYSEPTKNPGTWRPGGIWIHDGRSNDTVYEGPEAESVPALMHELVESLNEASDEVPIVRAALAHLNLTMIHPFSDGNGRMARCLQTLVLGREASVLSPQFASIEEYLRRNRDEYYACLAEVGQGRWNPGNDTKPWIRFCLKAHYVQARTLIRRAQQLYRLWSELDVVIKQHSLPERVKCGLSDAAQGLRVRNSTYRSAADVTSQLASRDLGLLVAKDLLAPHGEKRGRYYEATVKLRAVFEHVRLPKEVDDPFKRLASGQLKLIPPDD